MPNAHEQIENDKRSMITRHLRAAFEVLRLTAAEDEHLAKTPENVVDFWMEFLNPYLSQSAPPKITTFPAGEISGQCVLVKNLSYHSLCVHHLTPFFGVAHIAYIPDQTGIGISVPAKILEYYSRRPQLQERLAAQVADSLVTTCVPRGVMVLLTARQMCMEMRGERAEGIIECTAVRGCFEELAWQEMFFSRLKQ